MPIPRKIRVARAFDGARNYEMKADIQRMVADRLAKRILSLDIDLTAPALEIGCGTGFLTKTLVDRWPTISLTVNDIAPSMLERTRETVGERQNVRYLLLDAEKLTAPPASFGLIASSLAFQWFDHPAGIALRMAHMLKPGGWLILSTLDTGSFREWTAAQRSAGLQGLTRDYPDAKLFEDISEDMFDVQIDRYSLSRNYPNGMDFLRSLKAIGASARWDNRLFSRPRLLRRAIGFFEQQGATISYEIAEVAIQRKKEPEGL